MHMYVAVVVVAMGGVVVGKCIGVIQRLASNKETQTSSKESGHSIATLWHMSNQHAHILHLHMRWPYFNLNWSVMIFRSHRW